MFCFYASAGTGYGLLHIAEVKIKNPQFTWSLGTCKVRQFYLTGCILTFYFLETWKGSFSFSGFLLNLIEVVKETAFHLKK
jgi:hypothetical protein